jgi:beta-lysine N6-acetyltransferase
MLDTVSRIGCSVIHYGRMNDRVYLTKLSRKDYPEIIKELDILAVDNDYTRIFARIPDWAEDGFRALGYQKEAQIPGFFNGREDAFFVGKYFSKKRATMPVSERCLIDNVIRVARKKGRTPHEDETLPAGYRFRIAGADDSKDIMKIYKKVFEKDLYPVNDPQNIVDFMNSSGMFFGIWRDEKLVAVSSVEMDNESRSVEMADFATLPEERGLGLASFLLDEMHKEMKKRHMITSFTIARGLSYGMNIALAKKGYEFYGTLVHNTNFSGRIESMNVWSRPV